MLHPPFSLSMFSATARMHIDEMRSLLELWYDETHLKRWKAKRHGEFKVFNSVDQGLHFLNQPKKLLFTTVFLPHDRKSNGAQLIGSGSARGCPSRKL